ncbi:MAG: HD-like signal output (HDOD) protein/prolyl-tRNA editing enzyme YbaK/EbsC (Cys-tRNA(Pro) deacylase) [Oleiphilaceae bacterium]|jgi:HD-like signal output (HDOD) protein/prolyl-tRNA editing enzyme YbaK/EbsC (Cys-tRNA(Pro) deacylase)
MPIASKLNHFIESKGISYQALHHLRSDHLGHAIELANALPEFCVKAIPLIDKRGPAVAVIPYPADLDLRVINETFNRQFQRLDEAHYGKLFGDCEAGAVPALAMAYGLPVMLDADMLDNDYVFSASGCACTLLKMTRVVFRTAMLGAIKGRISKWPSVKSENFGVGVNACSGNISLDSVAKKLERLYQLPPMPETAVRIMHLTADPDSYVFQLAELIEKDPSLSAQVMRYARSALFSYRGELNSIKDAVNIVLGFDRVAQLSMGIASSKAFNIPQHGPLGLEKFWQHSLYAGVLCQALALMADPDLGINERDAYLAGLLHNFGILLIGHLFPPEFKMLNKLRESDPEASMADLERQVFGMGGAQEFISLGHGPMGAVLLKMWGLPNVCIKSAAMHQTARYQGDCEHYVCLVQLVNYYLAQVGIGDELVEYLPGPALVALGLDEENVQELVAKCIEQCRSLDGMISHMAA